MATSNKRNEINSRIAQVVDHAFTQMPIDHGKLADCGMALAADEHGEIKLHVLMGDEPIFHEHFEAFIRDETGERGLGEMRMKAHLAFASLVLARSLE